MKRIEEAIQNLDFGNKIIISRDIMIKDTEKHHGCLLKYDGKVYKEAIGIELGNFLDAIPMIREQINRGYFYQIAHIRRPEEYQCSIREVKYIDLDEYTNEIVNNLFTNSIKFEDGMLELEEKIANSVNSEKRLQKRKIA